MKKLKVYLAGQWNEYENNWKEELKEMPGFEFYDPEFDSNQSSSETFFQDDLKAVGEADILVANPGLAPSEATWLEIGYFYTLHHDPKRIIIVWNDNRKKWSLPFVEKMGTLVKTVEEAKEKLKSM